MNILIANHYLSLEASRGTQRHLLLAQELSSKGHHVTLVGCDRNHFKQQRDLRPWQPWALRPVSGGQILWVNSVGYSENNIWRYLNMVVFAVVFTIAGIFRLPRDFDVVVGSSGHLFTALAAYAVARWNRAQFCFEIRDLWPATLVEMGRLARGGWIARSMYRIEKLLIENADWVVGTMPGIHEYCERFAIDHSKVRWITNGVEIESFADTGAAGDSAAAFTICYFGSIGRPNAVDIIVEAARCLQGGGDFRFVIIGDGSERKTLEQKCIDDGLDSIRFLGAIPRSQIPAAAGDCDAFVVAVRRCPGLYKYGMSMNKLPEYMALGLPIAVSADFPYNPVAEVRCGVVVDPEDPDKLADAIRELSLLDSVERLLMGERGRECARRSYDYSNIISQYAEMLT